MTVNPETAPAVAQPSDKELNFRKQEEMFNRKLDQEKMARQQAEERLSQLERMVQNKGKADEDEDEPSDEPYVDHRRLQKAQARMEKKIVGETDNRINQAVQTALANERRQMWLETNSDFKDIMEHAQTFADRYPKMAKSILNMPEGFERQQLVYDAIKDLGLHKKEEPKSNIQATIDQNKRTPFYHPSGIGTAPYAGVVTYDRAQACSPTVQKNSYDQMKALQKRLGSFN
jgi:hypothetical protein